MNKKRVKELIYTYLTEWKVEEITCGCLTCCAVRDGLVDRDRLIEAIDNDEEEIP